VNNEVQSRAVLKHSSGGIGVSAISAVLLAAMPKCPLCWIALMGALGVGPAIRSVWLQPLAIILLLLPITALLIRASHRRGYGPFFLGLVAAASMYLFKFRLDQDAGFYLAGAVLLGASIWNALPRRTPAGGGQCHC
jgi:hypothetical protein